VKKGFSPALNFQTCKKWEMFIYSNHFTSLKLNSHSIKGLGSRDLPSFDA